MMWNPTTEDPGSEVAFETLLDWRRRVNHLYARVHSLLPTDPVAAHALWRAGRDELFAQHPQSPLARQARLGFQGLHVWRYDPAFAFTAVIQPVEEQRLEVLTSTGAPMPLVRFGQVTLPIGRLEVFWIDVYGGGCSFRFATRRAVVSLTEVGGTCWTPPRALTWVRRRAGSSSSTSISLTTLRASTTTRGAARLPRQGTC